MAKKSVNSVTHQEGYKIIARPLIAALVLLFLAKLSSLAAKPDGIIRIYYFAYFLTYMFIGQEIVKKARNSVLKVFLHANYGLSLAMIASVSLEFFPFFKNLDREIQIILNWPIVVSGLIILLATILGFYNIDETK